MTLLRPYFLILLIVPLLFIFWVKKSGRFNSWTKVCDPHLLPYLTVNINAQKTKFYSYLMCLLWIFGVIALSGPAILKKMPSVTTQSGLVVVADMSPVSDAKAIEQITHKLYDIADHKQDMSVGLVLADKNAYTAMPLTQDKNILKTMATQLKEQDIMPQVGQNIPAGIQKAAQLLSQSGFQKGQILILTAGVNDAKALKKQIPDTPYDLYFIGVGGHFEKTPVRLKTGTFWNNGQLYGLTDMPAVFGNKFLFASVDDNDLSHVFANAQMQLLDKNDNLAEYASDFGIWIVVVIIPLCALLFRKGVLFALALILLTTQANAGLWQRTEQEDYHTQMAAIDAFHAKNYEQALAGFQALSADDTEALYNQATTLAYMSKIPEAISLYEKVLQQNPNHQDAAFNLEYLKKQQQQSQQQNQQSQNNSQENKSNTQQQQEEQNQSQQDQDQNQEQNNNTQEQNPQHNQQTNADHQTNDTDKQQNEQMNPPQDSEEKESDERKADDAENEQPSNEEQEAEQQEAQNEQEQAQDDAKEEDNENKKTNQQMVQVQQVIDEQEQKQAELFNRLNFSDPGRVLKYRLHQQYEAQQ